MCVCVCVHVCLYIVSVCHDCFGIFATRQKLFEHKRKYQEDPRQDEDVLLHKCDVEGCDEIFCDVRTLNKHRNVHFKPFRCLCVIGIGVVCNKTFSNKRNLIVHRRSHNDDRREKCNFCEKSFCDPSTLKNHVKYRHAEVTPKQFICRVCHKTFARKYALQKHLETHSALIARKVYHCNHCDESFTVKSNRTRHVKRLHAIKKTAE